MKQKKRELSNWFGEILRKNANFKQWGYNNVMDAFRLALNTVEKKAKEKKK